MLRVQLFCWDCRIHTILRKWSNVGVSYQRKGIRNHKSADFWEQNNRMTWATISDHLIVNYLFLFIESFSVVLFMMDTSTIISQHFPRQSQPSNPISSQFIPTISKLAGNLTPSSSAPTNLIGNATASWPSRWTDVYFQAFKRTFWFLWDMVN